MEDLGEFVEIEITCMSCGVKERVKDETEWDCWWWLDNFGWDTDPDCTLCRDCREDE